VFVDTGMNREGVKLNELDDFLIRLRTMGNLKVVGCLTHLIASDDIDTSQTNRQIDDFEIAVKKIEKQFGKLDIIHSHNSAAVFNNIRDIGNYTRPGFAIYGFLPTRELFESSGLMPGIEIVSEVSLIKNVLQGETVGYSNKFVADRDIQIALIPFGYGHGFPAALSNNGVFSINGQACKIVGSVCMDFITVDVTDREVKIGDRVVIMGNDGVGDSIYDIADKANTLPYEIITHLLPRLDREYR
jgi:alanine racemase